jgi:hypothetical protein
MMKTLEQRVAELEQRQAAAGRLLLFSADQIKIARTLDQEDELDKLLADVGRALLFEGEQS